jgi:hypothetical protein
MKNGLDCNAMTSTAPDSQAQALALRGARRLTLAFSGREDAGTVGADPVGHWHYRLGSCGARGARDRLNQPGFDVDPRRQRTQLTTW